MPENKNKPAETPVIPQVPKEIKTVMVWKSASRPFKRRDREYFTTIAAIVFLLAVILLFLKEFLLIGVILAFMFVSYVLATVPPEEVDHKITTEGITTGGKSYLWTELKDFYFVQKWGSKILNINTKFKFPGRLIILLGSEEEKRIKEELGKYLSYRESAPITWMDNAADWLSQRVQLEKPS
ncbi:MAG: hypothetical protein M1120_01325 [Patescibacteria group bacterium]|nr:hypothetical protein [Patescibacteria group bacterium]